MFQLFFPTDLQRHLPPPPLHTPERLEQDARRALSACPAAPPWLEARWRALLSALISSTPSDTAPRGAAPPPEPALAHLITLCTLVTPRPHRPAALTALTSSYQSASAEASAREIAERTRDAILRALNADEWSDEARAALSDALTLPHTPP